MPLNKTLYIEEGLDILKHYDAIFISAIKGMQENRLLLPIMLSKPSKQDTLLCDHHHIRIATNQTMRPILAEDLTTKQDVTDAERVACVIRHAIVTHTE
ncbi:MAG: hypothetical protein HXN09_01645 [Porphyromonadaceae bacterium]|nr:hypothetical protein [Porphyromonadaceae bacterium]